MAALDKQCRAAHGDLAEIAVYGVLALAEMQRR